MLGKKIGNRFLFISLLVVRKLRLTSPATVATRRKRIVKRRPQSEHSITTLAALVSARLHKLWMARGHGQGYLCLSIIMRNALLCRAHDNSVEYHTPGQPPIVTTRSMSFSS